MVVNTPVAPTPTAVRTDPGSTPPGPTATSPLPPPSPSSQAPSSQAPSSQAPSADPAESATRPASPRPVGRSSTSTSTSTSRFPATTGSLVTPARWRDGLSVKITNTTIGKTAGVGPGARVGEPFVTFTMQLANASTRAIDISQVVVGVSYGASAAEATPVYDDSMTDFSGTLKSSASTTARYAFELPDPKNADVVVTIDVDAAHDVATMKGRIT